MERKLVTIRKINKIEPIEGADNIEMVTVDGWNLISKKGEFKIGDHCVYFEIDSFLPIKPEFEFLRKSSFKRMGEEEGFRLRTIKLRGQISQGLALPIDILSISDVKIGDDVTKLLDVKLYEKPLSPNLAGISKGNFPSFIIKTDQERIQNLWSLYHLKYKDVEFEETIKLDGTSNTYYIKYEDDESYKFGICSRNLELKEDGDSTRHILAKKYDIENKLKSLGMNIAIQGEIVGPGIQKNKEQLKEIDFYVFDVFDIDNYKYLGHNERLDIVNKLELKHVPILRTTKIFKEHDNIKSLLTHAEGSSLNSNNRKGLVYKSLDGQISFKVISNKYLLKNE